MRVSLVITSLSLGGAERVMSTIANYWAEKGWEVTLITLDYATSDFYKLHPNIKRIAMGLMGVSSNPLIAIKNILICIARLRHEIRSSKPDVIISFMDRINVLTLLATRGLGLKVIVSERTDPIYSEIGRIWFWLRRKTYPWANAIVAQTEKVSQWLQRYVEKSLVLVIPNPIVLLTDKKDSEMLLLRIIGKLEASRTIVAMGRLHPLKGFDLLIKAFAKIAHSNPSWRLVILGEGKERNSLEQLAKAVGITKSFFLPGSIKTPMQFLPQADIFVMASRCEGFPNALMEAMACGLPVISYDCPSGPCQIIRDGVDGLLVPPGDVDALAKAMEGLMMDGEQRKRLAERALEVTDRFALGKVMGMWESLIQRLLESPNKKI